MDAPSRSAIRAPARISPSAAAAWSAPAAANGAPVARRASAPTKASPASSPTRTGAEVADLQRCARGAQRVVLVQLGEAEDADDRVAGRPLAPRRRGGRTTSAKRSSSACSASGSSGADAGDEDAHEPAGGAGGRPRAPAAGPARSGCVTGSASAGSCASIARSSSRRCSPGSMPELVDERARGRPVGLQRLGLAAGPVQREHELAAEALAVRVLGDRAPRARPTTSACAPSARSRLDVQLGRREPQVGEARGLALARTPRRRDRRAAVRARARAPPRASPAARRARRRRGRPRASATSRSKRARVDPLGSTSSR